MGIRTVLLATQNGEKKAAEFQRSWSGWELQNGEYLLRLNKDAHLVEEVLSVWAPDAAEGVHGEQGVACGERAGYGPARVLGKDAVCAIERQLSTLRARLVPTPDPDGWSSDPLLETDEALARVAHRLDLYGADPDSAEVMEEIHRLICAFRTFYRNAANAEADVIAIRT